MRSLRRFLRAVAITVAMLVVLAVAAAGSAIWASLPRGDLSMAIPGLSAPVDIAIDADGIPGIRAANRLDAAAALGFLHARERLFQMDLMRRAAAGELSELLGAQALPYDRQMRTLGLRARAAADFPALPAEVRALLEAYARGVNA